MERAQAAIQTVVAEANKRGWAFNSTVVDPNGDLVTFARMDGAQLASIAISQHKARVAARYRRPTHALEDGVQKAGLNYLLTLDGKIEVLRRMVAFARSVPDAWNQHEILANTPKGLGVHALNLDLDIGPMLQTQKLVDSVVFARRKGFSRTLSAAELEMLNLTGDGNGFDMVTMPLSWRDQVPTANFFRASGYGDNPVAQRNNVVAKLIAATDSRMDEEIKKPGARELAALLQ
jgi:hypothetical protein